MKNLKNNKVQFLPGLGEKPKEYKRLLNYLDTLDVDWNTGKITPTIKKSDILVGFSMGAFLACEYALKHKITTLILCSPTPGAETLKDIKTNNVIFLVGSKEKWVIKDIQRIRKTLKSNSQVIIVPDAGHKIVGKYQQRLIEVLNM